MTEKSIFKSCQRRAARDTRTVRPARAQAANANDSAMPPLVDFG